MKKNLQLTLLAFILLLFFKPRLIAQSDTLYCETIISEGIRSYKKGDYAAAKTTLTKALALSKKIYGNTHRKVWITNFNLGKTETRLKNYTVAVNYLESALSVAKALGDSTKKELGYTHLELGNAQNWRSDYTNALFNYEQGTAVLEKTFGSESQDAGIGYMRLGLVYTNLGQFRKAESCFLKGEVISKKNLAPDHPEFNRIYNNLGNLYIKINDLDRALEYCQKALKIKLLNYDSLHPSVSKYYGNLADIYAYKGDYDKSLYYWNKGFEIDQNAFGKDHPITASTQINVANILKAKGDQEAALSIYQKSLSVFEQKLVPNHRYISRVKQRIGSLLEDENKLDQALHLYQESARLYQSNEFFSLQSIAATKKRIANVFFKKGKLDKALLNIGEAFEYIIPSFSYHPEKPYSNPLLTDVKSELLALDLLELKSKVLSKKHLTQNKFEDLSAAFKTSELAIQLIEKMRKGYQSKSAREFLNANTNSLFEKAVEQAYELYRMTKDSKYLFRAFQISEKSKANVLWQTLNERYAFEASNIPPSELETIRSIGIDIANYEKKLYKATDPKNIALLQNQIFEAKRKYETAIENLEQYNPKYYQLKYAAKDINLDAILSNIPDSKTVLIEYFYTAEKLFIFTFTQNGFQGFQMPIHFDLEQSILSLRQNDLQATILNPEATNQYISTLDTLHQLLIQPIHSVIQEAKDLILIPHGSLQLLSFDILTPASQNTDFRSLDYLLKSHTIHYAWSAALWKNQISKKIKPQIDFIGFAPRFKQESKPIAAANSLTFRANESELSHSIPEIQNAASFFSGKTFIDDVATETNFLSWAPQSNIIHLATHGIANDRFPLESGLVFSEKEDSLEDGFLNISEIYELELSAEIAIMSACNTGYGQIAKGEGVMSLGRAFMYAGCKSIISSLWLANDESTSTIIQGFYKYSAKGQSKNQALKNAKLDYLHQADALTAHPYFWANLITVGDMSPLQPKRISSLWWVALSVILLLSFWFFKRKK